MKVSVKSFKSAYSKLIKHPRKLSKAKEIKPSTQTEVYSRYAQNQYSPPGYDSSITYSPFAAFKLKQNGGRY